MSFLGAHPRCKVCEKRAFLTEQLKTPEGDTFHRACFRCKQCQKPLALDSYAVLEGLPYCKSHFEQLTSKKPSTAGEPATPPKLSVQKQSTDQPVTPPKVSIQQFNADQPATPPKLPLQKLQNELLRTPKTTSFKFLGTQDKCVACSKTVYPLEKVSVEGSSYHKSCFKCLQGGCSISPSNYAAMEGRIYCKHHFKQLFKEKGNYSQLLVKMPSSKLP
ncbi:hypothetical protein L7F22_058372 [Adiantum nelumboides]|nr:hypothetical protein [Adiantum nelumboides]